MFYNLVNMTLDFFFNESNYFIDLWEVNIKKHYEIKE